MPFKIKIYCDNNHELKKYDSKHKSSNDQQNDRLQCDTCNEYQDKKANNISKGVVYACEKCNCIVCMNCIIERFNLHFNLK
jgi:hypothetical protein